jgi:hypothetical protein
MRHRELIERLRRETLSSCDDPLNRGRLRGSDNFPASTETSVHVKACLEKAWQLSVEDVHSGSALLCVHQKICLIEYRKDERDGVEVTIALFVEMQRRGIQMSRN